MHYKAFMWTLLTPEGFRGGFRAFLPQQDIATGTTCRHSGTFSGFSA